MKRRNRTLFIISALLVCCTNISSLSFAIAGCNLQLSKNKLCLSENTIKEMIRDTLYTTKDKITRKKENRQTESKAYSNAPYQSSPYYAKQKTNSGYRGR